MSRSTRRYLGTSALVGLVLLAVAACGGGAGDSGDGGSAPGGSPIVLSVIASGPGVLYQPEIAESAQAAVAAINRAGGIASASGGPARPLKLDTCEAAITTDPNSPTRCARDAISDKAVAVVGKYVSSDTMTNTLSDAGVPLVGPIANTPADFSAKLSFPFYGGSTTVAAGAATILQSKGDRSLALVTLDAPSGRLLPSLIKPVLGAGARLVNETYLPADPSADITTLISRLVGAKPDGIAILTSPDLIVRATLALRQAGYTGHIAVPAATVNTEAVHQLGSDGNGILVVSNFWATIDTSNPKIKQYNEELDASKKGIGRSEFGLNAWLAVHLVADVLAELPTQDSASLASALAHRTVDLGASPPFTFGQAHNFLNFARLPNMNVQYQKIDDGKMVIDGNGAFVDLNTLAG